MWTLYSQAFHGPQHIFSYRLRITILLLLNFEFIFNKNHNTFYILVESHHEYFSSSDWSMLTIFKLQGNLGLNMHGEK